MKRVLVCALDWGLGHATRSIPVIHELRRQGAEVILAASNAAGKLLRQEFPTLDYHELPGYSPVYQAGGSLMLTIASQALKFTRAIRMEHQAVEALVRNLSVDRVVSDNRFGCYSERVPSVFMTHQYEVRLPGYWSAFERPVNSWLATHYNKYQDIWVPDQPGSGLTRSFVPSDAPVSYVGWLSRFSMKGSAAAEVDILAMVSGPEPQRKLFADQLRVELAASGLRALLVTGELTTSYRERVGQLEVVNHLPAREMEHALLSASVVIARSGYSTIMDLITLGKKAVLVPTPQQPEQIILARQLQELNVGFCPDQQNFTVEKARLEVARFQGFGHFKKEEGLLASAVQRLLS